MAVMLDVKNINVYYGAIHAVKDISFQVNEGEIVTLIGANGAGKTTTLQTVSGLLHTRTGSIEFLGQPIQNVPASKLVGRGLAQVPEGRRVFQQMTVEENLEMGGFTQPASTIAPGLERVYEQFPRLKERYRQVAGTLSGGEQQMLAMGRALMSNPKLLMLDEPSMGLAPLLVEQIFDIIKELHRAGTTILLVEQNAQMALSVADRVWMLENAVYSVISPEGCASILWKDAGKADEAAQRLRLTARDALELGIIEKIIPERDLGQPAFYGLLADRLEKELHVLMGQEDLLQRRYARFRAFGSPKPLETQPLVGVK